MAGYTRARQGGTIETMPDSGLERIAIVKRIVNNGQYEKVDGGMLDLFSASAIVAIYDKLSPDAQAKYRTIPVQRMAIMAFKLLG